jgi:hypothetical protein
LQNFNEAQVKPDWFDLKKYLEIGNFSPSDWCTMLTARSQLLGHFEPLEIKAYDEIFLIDNPEIDREVFERRQLELDRRRGEHWKKLFEQIKIDPLEPFLEDIDKHSAEVSIRIARNEHWANGVAEKYKGLFTKSLRALTMEDTYYLHYDIPKKARKAFSICRTSVNEHEDPDFSIGDYLKYSKQPIDLCETQSGSSPPNSNAIILLDLSSPDEELIRDFKFLLKKIRSMDEYCRDGKITKNDINRLGSLKVLPYLDLLIHEKFSDQHYPYHNIGDWLYPEEDVDVAEKIRKVTRPFSLKAISESFRDSLAKFSG